MVTRHAGFQLRLADLLKLAVMELFANQAIPTGGLSGSLLVARGLVRRRIPSSIAVTALLVAALSYYAAYFLMAALAFVLLWSTGDLSDTWEWLSITFATIVILITVCLVAVTATKGRWIPRSLLRRPLMARLAKAFAQVGPTWLAIRRYWVRQSSFNWRFSFWTRPRSGSPRELSGRASAPLLRFSPSFSRRSLQPSHLSRSAWARSKEAASQSSTCLESASKSLLLPR